MWKMPGKNRWRAQNGHVQAEGPSWQIAYLRWRFNYVAYVQKLDYRARALALPLPALRNAQLVIMSAQLWGMEA